MGIYKRGDSPFLWMAIERRGQKPIRLSTGIPKDGGPSMLAAAERLYDLEKAKHVLGRVEPEKPIIGFRAYADWYLAHVIAHRRGAMRDRSIVKQLMCYFARFESIADIDAETVEEWKTERRRQKKAPGTVNRELDVLKAMLTKAAPKYLVRSPLGSVRRFRVPESEPRTLSINDEDKLFAIANDEERAWLILAIDTLLRLSNVVHLQWAQVKAGQRVIIPLNAKVSHDTVPITPRLKLALDALDRDGDFVFPSYHIGKGPTAAKNALIRAFDTLCQKAELPYGRAAKGLTFHCLRHTGATRALQKGSSVRTVMKLGGWKGERMVMRYAHASDADVRTAAESIGARPTLVVHKKKA